MQNKMKMKVEHNEGRLSDYIKRIKFDDGNTLIYVHYTDATVIRHECLRKKTIDYAVIDFYKTTKEETKNA